MTPGEEKQLLEDVAEIKRGLFGEKNLEQPGLVKDVKDLKEWRQSVRIKMAFIVGITTAVGFAFERAWEWFTHK